jgi:hypothetical protein
MILTSIAQVRIVLYDSFHIDTYQAYRAACISGNLSSGTHPVCGSFSCTVQNKFDPEKRIQSSNK